MNANPVNAKMKNKKIRKITKKSKFSEIMKNEKARDVLMERGMHCFGCPFSQMESLEQGAKAHGINPEDLVKELNKKRKEKAGR